jgi:DNA modification methylase
MEAWPEGDVCDPFLGSGTTIVACEQLGRVGYGMEIVPAYVAVSLQRLHDMGLTCEVV